MRRAGEPILDLTESNPTHAALAYPADRILSALSHPDVLRYDPLPAGTTTARDAVAAYYARRGVTVDPGRILLTSSTSEAYSFLFKLLCDPGGEVLVPRPSYPLFDYLAALEGVVVKQYPLTYEGRWVLDFPGLEAMVTPSTRAVVVVHPNNPTGSFLKRDELSRLENLGIPILSDEVFADYAFGEDANRAGSLAAQSTTLAFTMSGLSKVAGLPQLKLGWIVTSGPAGLSAPAFERLEWIADTYLSVGTPVQSAAAPLLELPMRQRIHERVRFNLHTLRGQIGVASPFRILDLEGGWYATLEVPRIRTEEEWTTALLRDKAVLVQPGYFYDFEREAFLVLSLLTQPDIFSEGVRRLLQCA